MVMIIVRSNLFDSVYINVKILAENHIALNSKSNWNLSKPLINMFALTGYWNQYARFNILQNFSIKSWDLQISIAKRECFACGLGLILLLSCSNQNWWRYVRFLRTNQSTGRSGHYFFGKGSRTKLFFPQLNVARVWFRTQCHLYTEIFGYRCDSQSGFSLVI